MASPPAYFSLAPGAGQRQGALKVYDMMSQPTRAVVMFCAINKIPYSFENVLISKLQHRSPENLQRHPFGQVPNIDDGGFVVFESHSILRYLADRYQTPDHWYPKDLCARARVDQYLDWHHQNTRVMAKLSFTKVLAPRMNLPVDPKDVELYQKQTHIALRSLNNVWLSNRNYLTGDKMSIADLSALCEITQLKLMKYNFDKYPNVVAWLGRMTALPEYASAHEVVHKVISKL